MREQLIELAQKARPELVSRFSELSRYDAAELAINLSVENADKGGDFGIPEISFLVGQLEHSSLDEHIDAATILTDVVDAMLAPARITEEDLEKPDFLFKKIMETTG